jgi:hypothetical protein
MTQLSSPVHTYRQQRAYISSYVKIRAAAVIVSESSTFVHVRIPLSRIWTTTDGPWSGSDVAVVHGKISVILGIDRADCAAGTWLQLVWYRKNGRLGWSHMRPQCP